MLYFHIKSSQSNESNSFTFMDNDTHWVYSFHQIGPLCNTLSLKPDTFIHRANSTFRIHSNITHNRCNLITPFLSNKHFIHVFIYTSLYITSFYYHIMYFDIIINTGESWSLYSMILNLIFKDPIS